MCFLWPEIASGHNQASSCLMAMCYAALTGDLKYTLIVNKIIMYVHAWFNYNDKKWRSCICGTHQWPMWQNKCRYCLAPIWRHYYLSKLNLSPMRVVFQSHLSAHLTGGGQKLRTGQPCPSCSRQHFQVNVFCLCFACYTHITLIPPLGQISSKTEAKYIHLKMLSATGRTRLLVHSFCPPPVIYMLSTLQWTRFCPVVTLFTHCDKFHMI